MLQHTQPDDFVVSTNEAFSIRQFLDEAFSHAALDWREYVEVDLSYFRPTEVDYLLGDSSKARAALGWKPRTTFNQLVQMMVNADIELANEEREVSNRKSRKPSSE